MFWNTSATLITVSRWRLNQYNSLKDLSTCRQRTLEIFSDQNFQELCEEWRNSVRRDNRNHKHNQQRGSFRERQKKYFENNSKCWCIGWERQSQRSNWWDWYRLIRQTVADFTLLTDFMIAGIELFSHTVSFLLYYLSTNPEIQEKIFQETSNMSEDLTFEDISRAFYTRAAIHEAFRLSPSAFAIARILEEEIYLSGYRVQPGVSFWNFNRIRNANHSFLLTDCRVVPEYDRLF